MNLGFVALSACRPVLRPHGGDPVALDVFSVASPLAADIGTVVPPPCPNEQRPAVQSGAASESRQVPLQRECDRAVESLSLVTTNTPDDLSTRPSGHLSQPELKPRVDRRTVLVAKGGQERPRPILAGA